MDEILEAFQAEEGEHLLLVLFGGAEMAGEKGEILGDRGGGGGLGGGRGLFRGGGGGDRHFWKIRWVRRLARVEGKLVSGGWEELV